ncbi:MAG: hypothetical protein NZ551_10960 [Microscillaceae bacterium]|nr:hypothetical protein [Microscillaceae bacterium]MDW8461716.1 hypothetical protein [Cytophagales bacterium]
MRQYFIPAFHVKVIGAISVGLIYQFYYGKGNPSGDTFVFFADASQIYRAFWEAPDVALKLIFWATPNNYTPDIYDYAVRIYYFIDPRTYNIIRIAGFLSFFTFHTYSVIAIFIALFCFSGLWATYRAFCDMFPDLYRPLAVACFFIPSVFFWGSGLLKDSISMGILGWMFYYLYFGFFKLKNVWTAAIMLVIMFIFMRYFRVHILMGFVPSAALWLFLQYRSYIRNTFIRLISFPVLLAIALPFAFLALQKIAEEDAQYNLNQVAQTAKVSNDWLVYMSTVEKGSTYSLGEFDGTITGLIAKMPQAIWLSLYRPYPWEAKSFIMFLSAIESFLLLYLSIRVFLSTRIGKLIIIFTEKPVLVFCLVFSLFFGFAVAISSGNFGTMVRYRIAFLPFFLAMIYIIHFQVNGNRKLI